MVEDRYEREINNCAYQQQEDNQHGNKAGLKLFLFHVFNVAWSAYHYNHRRQVFKGKTGVK
ncbi:MAG TPA: hypothetical protein VFH37_01285 [Candidatus Saccharimonadales bacterium]|nr:hypothetical protein [Candidatus Saccharimonadales bacterium]